MPELEENQASCSVHRSGYHAPSLHLFHGKDAGCVWIPEAFGRHGCGLRIRQPPHQEPELPPPEEEPPPEPDELDEGDTRGMMRW